MLEVKGEVSTSGLSEIGQNYVMYFTFLKKEGPDTYTHITRKFKCRDYISDAVMGMTTDSPAYGKYGFYWNGTKHKVNDTYALAVWPDAAYFFTLDKISSALKLITNHFGLEPIRVQQYKDYFILDIPRVLYTKPLLLHVFTYILKMLSIPAKSKSSYLKTALRYRITHNVVDSLYTDGTLLSKYIDNWDNITKLFKNILNSNIDMLAVRSAAAKFGNKAGGEIWVVHNKMGSTSFVEFAMVPFKVTPVDDTTTNAAWRANLISALAAHAG